MVNDIASTGSDHDCNDENKYASLLAQRKDRMSVSQQDRVDGVRVNHFTTFCKDKSKTRCALRWANPLLKFLSTS